MLPFTPKPLIALGRLHASIYEKRLRFRIQRKIALNFVCASLLLFSAQQIVPQQADVLDLSVEEAVSIALRNNLQFGNTRLQRSVDEYALEIAESEFWPRFVARANTNQDRLTDEETTGIESAIRVRIPTGGEFSLGTRGTRLGFSADIDPSEGSHVGVTELRFVQPLMRGGGFKVGRATIKRARIAEEISVQSLRLAISNLILNVLRDYRSHIRSRRQTEIAVRSLERAQNLLSINQLLVETGRMAEQDVVQAEADIARRELNLISAQSSLDATRLALIDILDLDTETQFGELEALDPSQIVRRELDSATGLAIALENRPDYRSAVLGTKDATIRTEVAKNARLWDLSLNLGWTFRGAESDFALAWEELGKTGQSMSLDLEIPIGRNARGSVELALRQAEASLQMTENRLTDLHQKIVIDVENSLRNVEIAVRQMDLAGRARQLAEQKADIEREKLSLGVTTNFQLVAFENDLVLAETNELNAIVDYLNSVSDLDRALGTTIDTWNIDVEHVSSLDSDNEARAILPSP